MLDNIYKNLKPGLKLLPKCADRKIQVWDSGFFEKGQNSGIYGERATEILVAKYHKGKSSLIFFSRCDSISLHLPLSDWLTVMRMN